MEIDRNTASALNPAPTGSASLAGELPARAWPAGVVIADANPWLRREIGLNIQPYLGRETVQEARSPSEVLMRVADPNCRALVIDPCMPTIGQTDGMPLLRRIYCLRRDLHILVLARQPQLLLRDKSFPRQIAHVYGKNISAAWLGRFIAMALRQA